MMSKSQLSFASSNEIDPVILAPFEAPPDLNWEGQRWVRVDHLANQRKGAKKSQVWDLGDKYISLNSGAVRSGLFPQCRQRSNEYLARQDD